MHFFFPIICIKKNCLLPGTFTNIAAVRLKLQTSIWIFYKDFITEVPHGDQRVNLRKKFPLKNKSTIMGMGFNIYLQVVFISIRIFGCCFPLAPRSSRTTATVPIQHAVIKIKTLLPACILKIVPISLLFFQRKQKDAHSRVRHLEL